ncbi:hypothetical protein V6N11_033207 [Hibiscus sabdariffa]|uniref:non-specific serine/threonine protein kinase n=1 Tax=Hibiscus sabdariffa TaxID=183260 RepID=A0ABR2PXC9_9ROSI
MFHSDFRQSQRKACMLLCLWGMLNQIDCSASDLGQKPSLSKPRPIHFCGLNMDALLYEASRPAKFYYELGRNFKCLNEKPENWRFMSTSITERRPLKHVASFYCRAAISDSEEKITHDPIGVLGTWNLTSPFCNWTGITCNVTKQRVTSINLESLGLVGTIAPHIGNLSFLNYLNLQNNSFFGTMPQEIGRLFRLRTLSLGSNQIQGMIPVSLSLCSRLSYLDLSYNHLQGSIPSELGALSELEDVSFSNNFLTGHIPSSFGNLSSLSNLILMSNSLKGPLPEGIGRLPFLIKLQIGLNNISGEIPHSLLNSSSLSFLAMAVNRLTGNLSRQLSLLVMNNNFFEGTLPGEISNLVNVTLIAFEHNSLTGTIPPSIGTLPNLQYIFLHENRFSGKIPESLGNLTYLAEVHLSNNLLEGTIPSSLGNCQRLQLLDLSVNLLNGTIPRDVFRIRSFGMVLNLSYNSLTGFVPSEIGRLNMIQAIDFSSNKLSGDIPFAIGDCSSLLYLDMSRNSFQGTIPNSLDKLKGIDYIDLSSNKLTGNIPASLESLRFLQVLNLSRNQLTGEVPTAGIFRNLTAVSLSENLDLCGGVPGLGLPKCDSPGKKSSGSRLRTVLIASFASVAFIFASMLGFWFVTRRKDSGNRQVNEEADSPEIYPMYRQHDLKLATRNFSSECLIGEGSFGSVYKGVLNDGSLAAIKVFKMGQHGASKSFLAECEALRSSIGYMAPEYGMGAGVSTRGDVYSFGIVILEMFTGKRPVDNMFSGDMDLQRWVSTHLAGNSRDIVDHELKQKEGQPAYDDGIGRMLNIGLMCARKSPEERPTMREVSVMIKKVKAGLSEQYTIM